MNDQEKINIELQFIALQQENLALKKELLMIKLKEVEDSGKETNSYDTQGTENDS